MREIALLICLTFSLSCTTNNSKQGSNESDTDSLKRVSQSLSLDSSAKYTRQFDGNLPTIGLLMYNGVLQSEVIATSDVFSKPNGAEGEQLFDVITISETEDPIVTEEGMRFIPDYSFDNCPALDVLFVPSAYDMYTQVHNLKLINFIKEKNEETDYIVSNCAGAQLIGASGIADGHKIVTWIGGGDQLQKEFPNLKVQNDSTVTYVKDGKFLSSNGNLTSYISALNLLEILTSVEHRKFVEDYLYLERLKNWQSN